MTKEFSQTEIVSRMQLKNCSRKNHNPGFTMLYMINGRWHQCTLNFIASIEDAHGPGNFLRVLIEGAGERQRYKAAKVTTARTFWVPAVNNHRGFGRWDFIVIVDPWDAQNLSRGSFSDGVTA